MGDMSLNLKFGTHMAILTSMRRIFASHRQDLSVAPHRVISVVEADFESGGWGMQFGNIMELARDTPTSVLCEAWEEDAVDVQACKTGERPMTIREVGALAEVHGMKLLDVIAL
jgi:hypothetical protein